MYVDNNPTTSAGEKYRYAYFPNGTPTDLRPFTTKTHSIGQRTLYYSPNGLVNANTTWDPSGLPQSTTDDFGTSNYTFGNGLMTSNTRSNVTWQYTYDTTFPILVSTIIPLRDRFAARSGKESSTSTSRSGRLHVRRRR